jgi:hypothetical protein
MTKQDDLIAYLFDGGSHLLSGELLHWMVSSSRFTGFVDTYRDKIRKKIRVTQEAEGVLDVRSELAVAYSLLNDRRLDVAYEPYASTGSRAPDYAVTYRANLIFNVEVARIHVEEKGPERILRILLDKLRQMQPGMPNILVIQAREELAQAIDLGSLMRELKIRVEGKDPSFYTNSRYDGPAAFYKDFLHLSGLILWADTARVWTNKQSRPGMEGKILRIVALALQSTA